MKLKQYLNEAKKKLKEPWEMSKKEYDILFDGSNQKSSNQINKMIEKELSFIKTIKDGRIIFTDGTNGELDIVSRNGLIVLSNIKFDKKNTGRGTTIIQKLKQYADINGYSFEISKAYNTSFWIKQGFNLKGTDFPRIEGSGGSSSHELHVQRAIQQGKIKSHRDYK